MGNLIYLLIHQSFKHLLSTFYISGKALDTGDIKMSKKDTVAPRMHILERMIDTYTESYLCPE